MKTHSQLFAGAAFAALMAVSPVASTQAQDSGSMQLGGTTVTVGAGTALLTLPDINFNFLLNSTSDAAIGLLENNDIGGEIGWNINGAIELPMTGIGGGSKAMVIKGFYARIENEDILACTSTTTALCTVGDIVDEPGVNDFDITPVGNTMRVLTDRDVAHWGVAAEAKVLRMSGGMKDQQPARRRYIAVGADFRAIEQNIDIDGGVVELPVNGFEYDEDLDTYYYGAFLAYGGDYSLPFGGGLMSRLGLQSSFRVQGGVYHADADYDGRYHVFGVGGTDLTNLSLSKDDVAFISGITLETKKRIGRRATLSLNSEYEYYSWVPDMKYNNHQAGFAAAQGINVGTSIGGDDAFSARTSLRLTIKLGPDSVMESYK